MSDNHNAISLQRKYLNALGKMTEDDFTRSILKPLFESMGYFRVDFNGGPYERGRDLIAQMRIPPRKTPSITYVQSKKLDEKQKVNESVKISQLLHQLRQCKNEGVIGFEGERLFPETIYLASPTQMTSRFMEDINSQFFDKNFEVLPLDGVLVLELIQEYNSSLFENVVVN
jgi:hypothetical protein